MTPKQMTFIREYLVDLNATQAAMRAGYSPRTAFRIGQENMQKPAIRGEIERAMAERSARTEISADRVVKELACIAFVNIGDFVNADGVPDLSNLMAAQWAAVEEIQTEIYTEGRGEGAVRVKRVKIKLNDKLLALDKLMRHLGLYQDKLKLAGEAENPLFLLIKEIQGTAIKPVPNHLLPKPGEDDEAA